MVIFIIFYSLEKKHPIDVYNLIFSEIKLVRNVNYVKMGATLFGPCLNNPNINLNSFFDEILSKLQIEQVNFYKKIFVYSFKKTLMEIYIDFWLSNWNFKPQKFVKSSFAILQKLIVNSKNDFDSILNNIKWILDKACHRFFKH